ncbi:dtw domain-containing protein [Cyclospora cayetanensis]|uniref:tRNA-uridine aminocarboxypropyltransferase 1 n=1 Tax=Cyclospora cayetanensis TaxID=88456 RepID=A0A1D3D301_9EIME|nr:dtw domain-containing protein [Cyclospora cayetanensis]
MGFLVRRRVDVESLCLDWAAVERVLQDGEEQFSDGGGPRGCPGGPPAAAGVNAEAEDYTPLLPDIQGARAPSTCNGGPSSDPPPRRRSESAVAGRRRCCGGCGRQRAFYCSSCCCLVLSEATASHVPRVALPFRLHVVRHPKEKAAKSSAIPLRLLAPNDAVLYEVHGSLLSEILPRQQRGQEAAAGASKKSKKNAAEGPLTRVETAATSCTARSLQRDCPQFFPEGTRVWGGPSGGPPSPWASRKGVVLLLPEEGAPPASRIRWEEITDVVVADCTWYQVPGMQKHPALKELPRVRLDGQGGAFWRRHKGGPPEFLSSAEAVYLLLREYDCRIRATRASPYVPKGLLPSPVACCARDEGNAARAAQPAVPPLSAAASAASHRERDLCLPSHEHRKQQRVPLAPPLSASETEALWRQYDGRYDSLLFFFVLNRKAIEQSKAFRHSRETPHTKPLSGGLSCT